MDPRANPYAVLSLIVAPAVMTNASTLFAMSTSNRLARAADRAHEISKQLEAAGDMTTPESLRRLRELAAAKQRALLLLSTLRSHYVALGGFAATTLFSLLGAVLVPTGWETIVGALMVVGVAVGIAAVTALIHGSAALVRETRIAVRVLRERADNVRKRAEKPAGV